MVRDDRATLFVIITPTFLGVFIYILYQWKQLYNVQHHLSIDTKRVIIHQEIWELWVCLKIEIHEIHEIHKMYEIHCLKIEIHA